MQLHRLALHARLAGAELESSSTGLETLFLSVYLFQTILSTIMSAFGKLASSAGIGFMELVLFRNIATAVLTIPMLVKSHVNPYNHKLDARFALICLRGFLGFCSLATWYLALALMPLSDALAISFISPIMVAITAPFVLKEPTPPGLCWTLPLCAGGMILVAQPSFLFGAKGGSGPTTIGFIVGLVQAVLSTASKLAIRALATGDHQESVSDLVWHMALISVVGSFVGTLIIPGEMTWPTTPRVWGYLVALMLLGWGVQLLFTAAMQHVTAAKASALDYSSLIWSLVADATVFGYVPSPLSLLGAGVIVASSLASTLASRRSKAAAQAGDTAAAAPLTSSQKNAIQLRKMVKYDSMRDNGRLTAVLDGVRDAEAAGLLADAASREGSLTAPAPLALRMPPGSPRRSPLVAALAAAVPAVPEEDEWKLSAGMNERAAAAAVAAVPMATVVHRPPRRTSSEKEAALRQAGR